MTSLVKVYKFSGPPQCKMDLKKKKKEKVNVLLTRTFQVAEVPKAVLFQKCRLGYLSGREVGGASIPSCGPGALAFSFRTVGEKRKRFYLLKPRVAGPHPPPSSFLVQSRCWSFRYQGLSASPRSLCFSNSVQPKQGNLFLEYFHLGYPPSEEDSPTKRLTLWAFRRSRWRRSGVLGIPTDSVGTLVGVPGTSPVGEADE